MLLFVISEAMLFAGLISAFTIARASAVMWPPIGQPRLPLEATAVNTAALLASGVLLAVTRKRLRRDPSKASGAMLFSVLLGAAFVFLQGSEWIGLLGEGLTLHSSILGSFFYLIIGLHGLHAIVALGVLVYAWIGLRRGTVTSNRMAGAEIFWYFVVGLWPVLYLVVYR